MIQKEPIDQRFAEIKELQAYLSQYKGLQYEEFRRLPKIFGGAARFVQLIAKYTIEISRQITFDLKLSWQDYSQLFNQMQKAGAIDAKTSKELSSLADYYLEKTLSRKKISELHKMVRDVDGLVVSYSKQINDLLKNNE